MAKKNTKSKELPVLVENENIKALKVKWLKLAPHEKIGKTKSVTKRLDDIEREIKELQNDDTNKS